MFLNSFACVFAVYNTGKTFILMKKKNFHCSNLVDAPLNVSTKLEQCKVKLNIAKIQKDF